MLKNYYTGFKGYPKIDFYTYINGEKTGIEILNMNNNKRYSMTYLKTR
ncbi:TPA: dihydroorotate dehydrogenase (quinone), partial [Listeria innocua]|nr:dihydroorotate dehydrogenase (quinone) [Listeria innocua]